MTPIEQVRPATPGNWLRRPEGRLKRSGQEGRKEHGASDSADRSHDESGPAPAPDGREHSIDELA